MIPEDFKFEEGQVFERNLSDENNVERARVIKYNNNGDLSIKFPSLDRIIFYKMEKVINYTAF